MCHVGYAMGYDWSVMDCVCSCCDVAFVHALLQV